MTLPTVKHVLATLQRLRSFNISVPELLWTAPECLREAADIDQQKADIFAMGIIFKEIFTRSGPYTDYPFLVAHGMLTSSPYANKNYLCQYNRLYYFWYMSK